MKKWLRNATLGFAAVVALSACGAGNDDNGDNATGDGTTDASDFTVGMVTDVGGIDDKSFNQSAWEGLQAFGEDLNLVENTNYSYVQSANENEFEPNLRNLVREDTDLVWGIGFLMEDAIRTIAEQNEDAQLAIVDTVVLNPDTKEPYDNIANITFKEHEGSFLAGVVAALESETDQIGFIGGVESGLIKKFEVGFKAGVKAVNPDAEIAVQYVESFNDQTTAQQIANTMYSQGADIIYHAAGDSGNGLFTEAINRARNGENVWVIGVDADQYEQGVYGDESVTLTSMVKRVDVAVALVSEDTMNGNFPGGQVLEYGLDDNGVGISESTQNLSDGTEDEVDNYREQILSGEIEVPQTDEEYDEFVSGL
ncbi:BMP family lipoprotein [Alkalihalobacillus pseudalcaliphilus]|uniref:BMP family lipoprotein n=1 Tax=Alkalihalobacillus pseudalcaliphilus TaxID=79884 RepID=UPI00064DE893|nr:BMP family protein [Alkalihalobacillus pseudalcaliphilus]KMK75296.1 CD4+ T-cell-stimulating antigen [Alkalihalobacillus pseudalcaliphilus]